MQMPKDIGPFHIVGIGGIGMSAIAEILFELGYEVQGSDQRDSANVQRLRERGLRVFIGHDKINLAGIKGHPGMGRRAGYVVVSTAVRPDNPELVEARAQGIPIVQRKEMLAELMRFHDTVSVTGTHGKTTTTSMIAHLFDVGGLEPTAMSGGIINDWGTNARHGQGNWIVVEADESDGTFMALPTKIGVITNIDPEHLDYYGSVEAMHLAFRTFIASIPFYGTAVAGIDHPVVRSILEDLGREKRRRVISYGVADDANVRLVSSSVEGAGSRFSIAVRGEVSGGERLVEDLFLPLPGHYNMLNAMAAFAVAAEAGMTDDQIREGLASFGGVKRRYTFTGTWNGVNFYDDYAHHPVEIAAVLAAAKRSTTGRVIAIVQPHRYSRLASLFDEFCQCFGDADAILVAPVYAAGETPINGRDHRALVEGIRRAGKADAIAVDSEADLMPILARFAQPGDTVLGLGAGNVTEWSHALPNDLAEFRQVVSGAA